MTEQLRQLSDASTRYEDTLPLDRQLQVARARNARLADENARLARRLAELETLSAAVRESRRAALNVMEDAVSSNRRVEKLNLDLTHEITERQRMEAALRASENLLRTLADVVPQIIWANDAQGEANYFNQRWYDFSGLTYEQSAGPGWQAIVHPDDAPHSGRKWQEVLAKGEAFECEYRLRRADGEYRWFIGRNVPLRDETGVTGWFGSATDIQELKEAQAAAQQREEQFRRAIEDAPIPVIMYAEDGQVLQLSRNWVTLTGYAPEEVPSFDAWFARTSAPGAEALRQRLREVFTTTEKTEQLEFEIVTRRGERRYWLFSASVPGTLRDSRRYAVGMAIDLTERKRAEEALAASQERLRLIVDGALEHAIMSMDLQRRVTSWNSGAERMLGFSRSEMEGRSADAIFTPEDRAAGLPEREAQVALDQGRAADERWHQRKDGSRFWASGVMLPLYERRGGAPSRLIKILRDETEKRLAHQQLEQSRQELMRALTAADLARAQAVAAMQARDDFLAALSHELRTPLNPALLLASEAANEPSVPEPLRERFEAIRDNVQLEARLIDDLLDLTRITHGKLPLDRRETDAHQVLKEAVAIVRPDAARKNITLQVALAAERTVLTADPVRLQQVVWNVLKNAVKFTADGGTVELRTSNPAGADKLAVTVVDNGIGLTPAEIDGLFQAFIQGEHADRGGAHRFGGLGLGLAITRMLVELHGGSIRAISAGRNQGSTFEIELPLSEVCATLPGGEPRCARKALTEDELKRLRRERVLLVEDHEPTRRALAALLKRRQLVVATAGSLAEARHLASSTQFTLLISDIGLPDGTGYELMQELRAQQNLRGVALTGYGTDEDVASSRKAGFRAHVTKPVSAEALDRALLSLVSGPS